MLYRLLALSCLLIPGTATLADNTPQRKLPPAAKRKVVFARDIRPILERSCIACHGSEKQRASLRLDDAVHANKGGDTGPAYKPGDSAKSLLVRLAAGLEGDDRHMPPGKRKKLTPEEIGLLRAWIDQGANWPKGTSTTQTTRSAHWAFQPIGRPALPGVKDSAWLRNGIDAFVLARLEKEKIAPSPEADRITLMRRVYLDITGLPPSPDEIDAYLADSRPGAYERLVDRLLASPAYGERWARRWLDLARYADSDGYEKDSGRPFAWRYRQWVIEALNRDLTYDQFTIEQLAGDLLPGATTEQKVATGFHRNTLTNREGGVDREQFRVEAVVDRVNTTARVWLGLTLGCAQCHDHKYDPLAQREYYQFFAFFNSADEVNIAAPVPGYSATVKLSAAQQKRLNALLAKEKTYREKQLPLLQARWERILTPVQRKVLPRDVAAALAIATNKRTQQQTKTIQDFLTATDAGFQQLRRQIATLRKMTTGPVQAQTMARGKTRKTHIMIRGDFLRPGVEVKPAVPTVLSAMKTKAEPTRLDLARWLVDGKNPLTARVAVNWVWQKYFGRGLVATLEDFGTQGEKPSHPELLDWLAEEFMDRGWSLKDLHRLILTSATYRQSSKARPELHKRDPYNTLLARQVRNRMEAEVIRDVALASSGLLARMVGGPSVRPPQPAGISELTYAGSARWAESKGANRYRRGLYTWFQRTSPYPMLLTFDAPDSNLSCVRREKSNTPLQALTLLNDVVFVECAQALGQRVLAECKGDTQTRLAYAFRLCTARVPTSRELTRLMALYEELHDLCKADLEGAKKLAGTVPSGASVAELATWAVLGRALLNLDEAVTRE